MQLYNCVVERCLIVRQELFWDEFMHFIVSVVVRDFSSGSFRGVYDYRGLF